MATPRSLGIGVLGFGFMGRVHTYAYATLPWYYPSLAVKPRLVGVATARRETADAAAKGYGFAYGTDDWRRVVDDPRVDVVHVCTPNDRHREQVLAAIAAGKHLYVDKPLVATAADARRVAQALKPGRAGARYRGTHQIALHNRFFPVSMRARQVVAEGRLGRLTAFRAAYLHASNVDPGKALLWKLDHRAGGGVLNDLATHVVDLVETLTGPLDEVLAATRVLHRSRPDSADPRRRRTVTAEDAAYLTLRGGEGVLGTVEATKLATGTQDELRVEVHGTLGALRFNLRDPNYLEIYDNRPPEAPLGGERGFKAIECVQRYPPPAAPFPGPKLNTGWLRGHVGSVGGFLDALLAGRKADPGLEIGVRQAYQMEAARISAREGRWVRVREVAG